MEAEFAGAGDEDVFAGAALDLRSTGGRADAGRRERPAPHSKRLWRGCSRRSSCCARAGSCWDSGPYPCHASTETRIVVVIVIAGFIFILSFLFLHRGCGLAAAADPGHD